MRVVVAFDAYNGRRYSRPWIARVTAWPVGDRATLEFGAYLGNERGGEVEIEAEPGAVVRWGQKDNRGNGTRAHYGIVSEDGTLSEYTESVCKKHFNQVKTPEIPSQGQAPH